MTLRLIVIMTSPLDQTSTAHRKYKKDLDLLKPDIIAYNLEKERALGLEPGTLVTTEEGGRMVLTTAAKEQAIMLSGMSFASQDARTRHTHEIRTGASASGSVAEGLYRDANSLSYADNKPSEEAIDRVVNKLNNECVSTY
jgi:pre-mRNA-splicing factor SYF2